MRHISSFVLAKRLKWCSNVWNRSAHFSFNIQFRAIFCFKTATAEKLASHMQEVAKIIKTLRAVFEITGYSARASIQKLEQNRFVLDFRVLLQERSINSSFLGSAKHRRNNAHQKCGSLSLLLCVRSLEVGQLGINLGNNLDRREGESARVLLPGSQSFRKKAGSLYLTTPRLHYTTIQLSYCMSMSIMEDKPLHVYDVMVIVSTRNNASAFKAELYKT